jgi:1-aminocyclopropane-1-carboxylate deaminase/D-cysteine desulfhydrase-like pyridoxal-dependent ACC family enzyme
VHAVNVQHTPETYYASIREESEALGATLEREGPVEDWLEIHHGEGAGYARTGPEELGFIRDVAAASGVVLDQVYTGKALYHFCEHAKADPEKYRGKRILFWHTGGLLGLYAAQEQLSPLMPTNQVELLKVPRM